MGFVKDVMATCGMTEGEAARAAAELEAMGEERLAAAVAAAASEDADGGGESPRREREAFNASDASDGPDVPGDGPIADA